MFHISGIEICGEPMIDLTETPAKELQLQAKAVKPAEADADVTRRALLAWLKAKESRERPGLLLDPVLVTFDGKLYAGLVNGKMILAVYRVRNDRQLKRLRRIPLPVCAALALNGHGEVNNWIERKAES